MTLYDKILKLDRRWIYLLVALAVIIPLLKPLGLPIEPTPPSKAVYDKIESIPEGGYVMIAMDFDPASKPELYPMTLALFKHCFKKNLKLIVLTLWPSGAALGEDAVTRAAKEYNKQSGVDYVYLGYKAGFAIVILSMGESIKNTFGTDYNGNPTNKMPIFEKMDRLNDLDYMIDIAAGASVEYWIAYGKERYKFDMGAGCTAVSATQYYPYINTGQLNGLLGGLKGAAEYELMADVKGLATMGMDAQSIVHVLIVIIVVITNILFLLSRTVPRKREGGN